MQLAPLTPTRTIELVQTTPNPGRLSITQAMIDGISAQNLVLGQGTAGGGTTVAGGATAGGVVIGNPGRRHRSREHPRS